MREFEPFSGITRPRHALVARSEREIEGARTVKGLVARGKVGRDERREIGFARIEKNFIDSLFSFLSLEISARIQNFIPVDMTLDRVMTFGRRIRGMKRKEKKNLNHSTRNVGIRLGSNIPDDSAG